MSETAFKFPHKKVNLVAIFERLKNVTKEDIIYNTFISIDNLLFYKFIKKDISNFPHTKEFQKIWDIYLICCYIKGYDFGDIIEHFFQIPIKGTYSYEPLNMAVDSLYEMDERGESYLI